MKLDLNGFLPLLEKEIEASFMSQRIKEIREYVVSVLPSSPHISAWFIDNSVSLDDWYLYSHLNQTAVQLLIIERDEILFEFLFSKRLMRYDVMKLKDISIVEEYTQQSESSTRTVFSFTHTVGGSPSETKLRERDNNVIANFREFTTKIKAAFLNR